MGLVVGLQDIPPAQASARGGGSIVEILTLTRVHPTYSYETYTSARNAFLNVEGLADLVTSTSPPPTSTRVSTTTTTADGASTTSTTTEGATTTTTGGSSTTSTTLASSVCGQPVSSGPTPVASDCLFILRAALGAESCEHECSCAPKGSLPITATDALICLKRALGQNVAMECPCGGTTTLPPTSTTTQAETSTTTLAPPTTTTTSTTTTSTIATTTTSTSTTTTTLGGSVVVGRAIYDARCSACHLAGGHDTSGFAPDLAGKGGLIVPNLGTINSMMSGITLSDQEISDLAEFFGSL